MNAVDRDIAFMRAELARNAGIFIEDDRGELRAAPAVIPVVVDREQIRETLSLLGAPERDLEWLTASCPSLVYALTYHPPEQS